ncbi:MAG: efflux RND transporter permease subunit, partial [Planctomycetales bacterium]
MAALSIRYRPVVLTAVMLLMSWGVYSYATMPRREDPEYTVRTCVVSTRWAGAPTEQVEELVTDKLEQVLDAIDEVDYVKSTTTVGLSEIYVYAEDFVTADRIDNVWDKVRARVARVEMPEAGIVPDVNDEFGDTNVILLAVYQVPLPGEDEIREENRYTLRQLDVISEKLKDALRLLDGVAKSEQYGVREEAVFIETDMGLWSQLSLTTLDLQRLVEARNIVAPGGDIDTEEGRFSVKPGGEFDTVHQLNSVVVAQGDRSGVNVPIYLKDLDLQVVRTYTDPPRQYCRFGDGYRSEPCVVVALTMKGGSNIVDLCNAAKDRVKQLQETQRILPPDVAVTPVSDQSENVVAKIDQVVGNVIGAVLIVVVVVYLVVGFRTSLVMAANIPVVVLAAVALITIFDVQLEQISLASIIIALGLLVDNAVQVCDQSRSNQMAGMSPKEGTIAGSSLLAFPMLSGTATTVAAFFPMLIGLEGSKKEYVYSLPVTLSVTLGISWILAMTFCTILAATFIRAPADPTKPSAPLPWLMAKIGKLFRSRKKSKDGTADDDDAGGDMVGNAFGWIAALAIKLKFVTVGGAFLLLALTLQLPVGSEFFPRDLRDQFPIEVWLPETSSIEQTDAVAQQVEAILRKLSPVLDENGQPVLDEDGQPMQRLRGVR